MTDVVPVVLFSTGHPLLVSTLPVFGPVCSASTVAPITVTSDVALDVALVIAPISVASIDVAPATGSCDVGPVAASESTASATASCDVAPAAASITTSSVLPPPFPALPSSPSSPLAFSASVHWSLNISATAVVLGVGSGHFRN